MKKLLLTNAFFFFLFSTALLAQPITFERHKIANINNANTSIRIHPADLNNDGAVDIVSSEAIGGERVHWWKSSGGSNPTFTKILIDNNFPQGGPFFTADVNGDGHLDILGTSFTGDKVVYWQNDGNNPTPAFTRTILKSGFNGALKVIAVDLDQDGDTDVAALARVSQQLRLFINDGNLNPTFTQVVLSNSLSHADGLAYGDINMDGLMDLVVAHPGNAKVTLFKGSATATNGFTSSVIQTPFACKNIYSADMNGDGHLDVLNLYQDGNLNKIGYLKNSGGTNPTFTNKFVGTYDNSFSIFPVDLDSDGDMDVLGGSNWEDGFRWWENQGGTNPTFQSHLIQAGFVMAWTAKPADMDGDGDLDFVASTGWAIHWFENDLYAPLEISCPPTQMVNVTDHFCEYVMEDFESLLTVEGGTPPYSVVQNPAPNTAIQGITSEEVTFTATDAIGQTATCSFTLEIQDNTAPFIECPPNQQEVANENCQFAIPDYMGSILVYLDNCGLPSISQTPASGFAQIGNTTIVLTATDNSGNTATCSFSLTVVDETKPSINCPSGFTQPNDPGDCGAIVDIPTATATDNCNVTFLKARTREVDENGDAISGWSSFSNDPDGFYAVGRWEVQWRAKDAANNKGNCKFIFEVIDDEAPTPVCLDPTVTFNGEATINLNLTDVYDAGASSDNCTDVIVNTFFPASVSCEELGSIIPVTVSVSDENGNATSCTAFVTVDGLPCGWSASPDGIGCPSGNDPSYDPNSETFSISSEGCYDPNYYSNSDSHGFASTELCGDGEIIAQVTQVSGNGWGGVSMRESLSAGAKMLQLSIDGVSLTKRELRQSTGGIAFNHLFQTMGNTWLRLTRSGNLFTAQHSSDGTNWATVIAVNISMASCIQVGLITENKTASGDATATFSNVEIKGGIAPLSAPEVPGDIAEGPSVEPKINLYPNPAKDEAWIDLGNHFDQVEAIHIYNNLGQLVESVTASAIGQGLVRLATHDWDNGLYLVKITIDEQTVTKRLIRRK